MFYWAGGCPSHLRRPLSFFPVPQNSGSHQQSQCSADGNKRIRVILNCICIVPGQLGLQETMTSNTVRSHSPDWGSCPWCWHCVGLGKAVDSHLYKFLALILRELDLTCPSTVLVGCCLPASQESLHCTVCSSQTIHVLPLLEGEKMDRQSTRIQKEAMKEWRWSHLHSTQPVGTPSGLCSNLFLTHVLTATFMLFPYQQDQFSPLSSRDKAFIIASVSWSFCFSLPSAGFACMCCHDHITSSLYWILRLEIWIWLPLCQC